VPDSPANETILARTARGAGWVMAWRLGMRALGLASTLVLVRLIAPADFGVIALATGVMQSIDAMLALGTEEAVIREAAPDRHFYDTAFTLNLLRGLSVTVLVAVCAYPAAGFFGDPRLGPVLLFVACLPLLDGVSNIGAVDFRREMRFEREFALMVLPKLGGILAAMGAAFALHSYVAMLAGMAVNRSLRVVTSYVMHPFRPRLSFRAWRGLLGYSLWTWALGLVLLLRERADGLVIGRCLGSAEVGFYSVGAEVAALPTTELIEPLGRAAFAGFSAGRAEGADLRAVFLRLIGGGALLALPACVGLSLVAEPLVGLALGPGWEAAVPVLRILALSGGAMVLGHLSQHLLSAHALLGRLTGIALAGAAVRVGLLVALVPALGLPGAAVAVAVAVVLEQALVVGTALRRFGVPVAALAERVWRPVVGAAAMAGAVGWPSGSGVLALAGAVASGALVYGAVLLACWWGAGRPPGAEADLLGLVNRLALRLRRR